MRAVNSSFYKSAVWKKARAAYLAEQPLCEECLKKGEYNPSRYVHHITELTEDNVTDPAIATGKVNLMALCFKCHEEKHGRKVNRRYRIKDNGEVEIN